MGLETDNIFSDEEDEFFVSEAEGRFSPNIVTKTADESIVSSTALQDDNELFYTLQGNSTYKFKFVLVVSNGGSHDPGFKILIDGPTGSTGIYYMTINTGDDIAFPYKLGVGADSFIDIVAIGSEMDDAAGGDNGINAIWVEGWIKTSSTTGNLKLQWTQHEIDSTDTTVHKNSYLEVTKQ